MLTKREKNGRNYLHYRLFVGRSTMRSTNTLPFAIIKMRNKMANEMNFVSCETHSEFENSFRETHSEFNTEFTTQLTMN